APWAAAQGPGPRRILGPEARRRVGRARGVEYDAETLGELLRLADQPALLVVAAGEQRLILPRQPLAFGEIDKALEIDFRHVHVVREADKVTELADRLLEPGQ